MTLAGLLSAVASMKIRFQRADIGVLFIVARLRHELTQLPYSTMLGVMQKPKRLRMAPARPEGDAWKGGYRLMYCTVLYFLPQV